MLSIGLSLKLYSVNPIIQAYRVQVTELNLPSILFPPARGLAWKQLQYE